MTAVTLSYPPIQFAIVDPKTGLATRSFQQWLAMGLWRRIGGAIAPSNDDITFTLESLPVDLGLVTAILDRLQKCEAALLSPTTLRAPDRSQIQPSQAVRATPNPDQTALLGQILQRLNEIERRVGTLTTGVLA